MSFIPVKAQELEMLGRINAIDQDIKGFMWFGGDNGLARYDGYELKIYNKTNSGLHSNRINAINVTSDGQLWVATGFGFSRYNAASDRFYTFLHPEASEQHYSVNNINTFLEDSQKRIWLGTEKGLYMFNRGTLKIKTKGFGSEREIKAWLAFTT